MRALLVVLAVLLGTVAPVPATAAEPRVTVSLTFDDGFASQAGAAEILAKHHLNGTFYIISGLVGSPNYLTWDQISSLADAGNEIGGHTVTHPHLNRLPYAQAKAEICDNRATLLARGFAVTDFAYPYGAPSADNERAAAECGYNSARDVSGLIDGVNASCLDCALSNPVPPADPYRIRGNSSTTDSLAGVEQYVSQARDGWVPLIFHRFCTSCAGEDGDEYMSLADFDTLLTWLEQRPGVSVRTVAQVIGGAVAPSVGNVISTPVADSAAWRPFGVPVGQEQVLVAGALVSIAGLGFYRVSRRRHRYVA